MHGQHGKPSRLSGAGSTIAEEAHLPIKAAYKRILKKYGYPPDLENDAIRTVIEQAEIWSSEWQVSQK